MGFLFAAAGTQLNRYMKTYTYLIRTSQGLAQTEPTHNLMRLRKDVTKYLTLLYQTGLITNEERHAVGDVAIAFVGDIMEREVDISKPKSPDMPHYKSPEYKLMKRREQLERAKQKKANLEKP